MKRSRSARRRTLGGGSILRIAVCAAGAVYLGWWVVRISGVNALVSTNPFAAAAIAPNHPQTRMTLAIVEMAMRNGRVSPQVERGAIDAMRQAALADDPFLLAGVATTAAGDPVKGEALLTEARRRNPRDRFVRLLLANRYLQTGRIEAAGAEIATLDRLIPGVSQALTPELARMARDPKTGPQFAKLLRRTPNMRDSVLYQLAQTGAPKELILSIAAASGSGSAPNAAPAWQGVLLNRLIGQKDIRAAYALWLQFGARVPAGQQGVYDGDFRGLPGSPPFNWELLSSGDGVAERAQGPALHVEYYGRSNVTLARQLLTLRPGAYRLQFRAEGAAKGEATRLAWSLSCAAGNSNLAQLPLTNITSAPRVLRASFVVPASGCDGQWLKLDGIAGDVPAQQSVTIANLRLDGAAK